MGALYRVAVGGEALRDLGPGGLQWTKIEWSLIGVATLLFLSAVLFCIPATALAAVATGDSPTLQGQSQVLLRDTDCAKGLDCAR
jgi:hypothetical protein